MNATRWLRLGSAGALVLLASPAGLDALCMQCAPTRPVCERANYSGCKTTQITSAGDMACDEWTASCAWTLNLSEIAADGSLAFAGADDLKADLTEEGATLRGCHGLIVARDYSEESVARLRARSANLKV